MPPVVAEDGDPHPAWSVPAGEDDYNDAAIFLLSAVEPEAEAPRAQFVAQILKTREYSRAELALVMRELPFDPDASHNYGGGLNPADIERVVSRHRELRVRLNQRMTAEERDDLIAAFPEQIDPEGFHVAGFTRHDEPLFRYVPNTEADPQEPNPDLGSSMPGAARQRDEATGETTFGKLVSKANEKAEEADVGTREAQDHMEGAEHKRRQDEE